MSNDLVVQLGAKLDQFQSDMDQAGNIADAAIARIEQSFASLNPTAGGFASLGVAAAGVTGLVGGLLAALTNVNSQLAELQKNAEFAGVTAERFQQIQFAAGQGGVSTSDAANDLQKVASLLADAKENENSLTRLLDANNIKYKDRNGQIISMNQLLTIAGDLLNRFDSIPEKTKAAQMLGLSQGWVEALRNGSQSFEELAQSADAAGAVIDGATVAKAAAFDRAWKQSSAQLAAQFKSVTADIGGWLDGLIDKANDLVKKALESQNVQPGSGQDTFNRWADAADILQKDLRGLPQDVDQVTRAIENLQASGKPENLQIAAGLELIRAKAQLAADMLKSVSDQQSKIDYPSGIPLPTARPAAANNADPNAAKLPKRKDGEEAADAYDRATESLNKYIVTTNAAVESQGKGAAATEEAKAEAQLLNAAQLAGIPVTQKVRDQIQELAQDAGEAADALAKAKVASDIQFGAKSAFLSPQDLAIANQLKGIYGNDIPEALRSAEAAGLRYNATIKDLATLGQQVNSGFLVDFETQIRNGASAMDALKTAGLNALGKIADKLAQMAADNLWSSAFGGSSGGGFNLFSLFGGGGKASNATDGIGGFGPTVPAFATGTDFAPGGMSLVGENGPELLNLPRGAQVIPNDVLRNGGAGGGSVTVRTGDVVIQGDASEKTVALINQALARQNAELPLRVVAAVKDAKARRVLA
ncbi:MULTISPECIES: hypothetical protein [Bradyrhizobium]|uniref:hypothetical protein n=1 Tax=Bradyrhizobium TaxID=374 RepID=UPI000480FC1E|nr:MULTISPECIES: hypothetical protein [Bradyrhizobium]MCS3449562.1 hypothetical protein [Bradyrhizobium elkanii]MCS3559295.1 hypothetical protein [Bradyrhizobium elkanii]MCW2150859.1 hypothetical protein [Bradyrhizobium elkanii]MCW2359098.1 hypothetical protein [Bradyrhizobium elkanii]MCW2374590.1 hypothetical protein [Bradyrhizobium elkanii]